MSTRWERWDREFVESRYTELSGDGIMPTQTAVGIIHKEMKGKYLPIAIKLVIRALRYRFPVPTKFRDDEKNGNIEKAKDGECCAKCWMPLYYRMQKDHKHIHSWFCPWCNSDEYVLDWRWKTNRKPVGDNLNVVMEDDV